MGEFDAQKAYVAKEAEETIFDDGRELELLHAIYSHPSLDTFRGSPSKVLGAIDEYGRSKKFLMNVGEDKGKIVTDLIAEVKPKTMVELGGYVGYSAVLFGDAMRRAGGKRYFSLERSPVFAAIIMSMVDLAGLSDVVKVVVGPSNDSIQRLHRDGVLQKIDLLFLDHYKPAYVADLKRCEELQLIRPGSVLAADNVVAPGNPPYLAYVRSSVEEKRQRYNDGGPADEAGNSGQQFPKQTKELYTQRYGDVKEDVEPRGNPKLIYESRLVESFEPTGVPDGVEITRCVGEEK